VGSVRNLHALGDVGSILREDSMDIQHLLNPIGSHYGLDDVVIVFIDEVLKKWARINEQFFDKGFSLSHAL
jgi:hypothetical protein